MNMSEQHIILEERIVGDIQGEFYIPSYQRGYRWDDIQVKALLNDIYENDTVSIPAQFPTWTASFLALCTDLAITSTSVLAGKLTAT